MVVTGALKCWIGSRSLAFSQNICFRLSEQGNHQQFKDPTEEFRERLAKRGFVMENIGMEEILAELSKQHELRDLALHSETGKPSEPQSEAVPGSVRYVGRNFFRLWAPSLFERERESFNRRQKTIPGSDADMDLILSALTPMSLALKPGRLSVDQLPALSTAAVLCEIGRRNYQDDAGNLVSQVRYSRLSSTLTKAVQTKILRTKDINIQMYLPVYGFSVLNWSYSDLGMGEGGGGSRPPPPSRSPPSPVPPPEFFWGKNLFS